VYDIQVEDDWEPGAIDTAVTVLLETHTEPFEVDPALHMTKPLHMVNSA
jgi:hypothetical protein